MNSAVDCDFCHPVAKYLFIALFSLKEGDKSSLLKEKKVQSLGAGAVAQW